jgi:flagellar biosynthesis GTPase FlhF
MFLFSWIKLFVGASAHLGWTAPDQTSIRKMSAFFCSSQYCRHWNSAATYRLTCCRVREYLQNQRLYCDYCFEELTKHRKCVCGDRSCCMEAEKVDDIIQRRRQREAVKKEQEAVRKLIMEEEQRKARTEQEEKLREEKLALWKEQERKAAEMKQNDAERARMKVKEEEEHAIAQFIAKVKEKEVEEYDKMMRKEVQEWFANPQ